jgi:hypothetical protein
VIFPPGFWAVGLFVLAVTDGGHEWPFLVFSTVDSSGDR